MNKRLGERSRSSATMNKDLFEFVSADRLANFQSN
jgi:hypothetical protein